MKKQNILLFVLIIIYLLYVLLDFGCPFRKLLGIFCPGCGMSRAYLSLLQLDIAKAFYYHPLFLMPIIWLILLIMDYQGKDISKAFIITVIIFIAVYLYRLVTNDFTILEIACLRAFWY